MDDPNAALPSDPAVDESYTKGSRPVRPRTRTSASTDAADRSSRAERAAATQRPAQGRTPGPSPVDMSTANAPQPRPTPGTGSSSPDVSGASRSACC